MANANDIRFDQRNPTNTAYQERYVSGSNLILRTDSSGSVTGTNTIENIPIGTVSRSLANFTALSASNFYTDNFSVDNFNTNTINTNAISASSAFFGLDIVVSGLLKVFGKLYAYSGIVGDVTGSVSGSNIIATSGIVTNLTSSNISASNYISSSNIYVENTITSDTGSFVYLNLNNTGSAPSSYTDSGMPGEIRFDNNFIYIYTNNVWVRTPIVRWTS